MPYDVVAYEADDLAMQLSESEEGLFHRMLRRAWMNGSIPSDMVELSRVCRTHATRLKKAWIRISPLWVPHDALPGRLVNSKQERERVWVDTKRETNRHIAENRWKALRDKRNDNANAERTQSERSTSPSPSPSPSQPNLNTGEEKGIPRKRGKPMTEAPNSLEITVEMYRFATDLGVGNADVETAAMLDHFRGKGELKADWLSVWRNWMRNHHKFGGNGNGSGRSKPVRETDHEKNQRAAREFVTRSMAPAMRGDLPDVREDFGGLPRKI